MRLVEFGRCAEISLAWTAACQRKGFMTEPRRRRVPDGRFLRMPRSDGRPIGGSFEGSEAPVTGKEQRIFPASAVWCEKPSRKPPRIQQLAGRPPKIPCAAEQGNNSTRTGKARRENRELIRHNRESGAKSRRTRFTSNTFSVEDKIISDHGLR
jgi:hypothetical protein